MWIIFFEYLAQKKIRVLKAQRALLEFPIITVSRADDAMSPILTWDKPALLWFQTPVDEIELEM